MFIPKSVFYISKVAAKESTRYAINGVLVERDGDKGRAVATDGRRLMVTTWTPDDFTQLTLEREQESPPVVDFRAVIQRDDWDTINRGIKSSRKYEPGVRVTEKVIDEQEEGVALDYTRTGEVATQPQQVPHIAGRFPKWTDVMPTIKVGAGGVEIGINPRLLGELLLAMHKSLGDTNGYGAYCRLMVSSDPASPLLIIAENRDKTIETQGVLMPVNLESYHCPVCGELRDVHDYNPLRGEIDRCDQCRLGDNGDDKRKKLPRANMAFEVVGRDTAAKVAGVLLGMAVPFSLTPLGGGDATFTIARDADDRVGRMLCKAKITVLWVAPPKSEEST